MVPAGDVALPAPILNRNRGFAAVPMDGGIRFAGTVEIAGLEASLNERRNAGRLLALFMQTRILDISVHGEARSSGGRGMGRAAGTTASSNAARRRSTLGRGGIEAEPNRPPSAASVIHARLRTEIISLQRKPGEPLAEKTITQAYGVSRTPVREAILRLANEGLVDIFPQSGTFVARIPQRALPEAIVIRMALEEKSARLAAERATRSQLMRVQAIIEQLRESEAAGNRDTFHQADEHFHAAIAEMASYPGIWALVQQVKVQVDRYRRLTLPQEGRMQRIIGQHQDILNAIAAHDPDLAAAKMNIHLGELIASFDDIRDVNPDYFTGGSHAE